MSFEVLSQNFVIIVLVACLVIGYIIKHATFLKWIPNDDIPVILAVIGAVLNSLVSGLSIDSVVYGAVMGLCTTGLHQAFSVFIEKNNNNDDEYDEDVSVSSIYNGYIDTDKNDAETTSDCSEEPPKARIINNDKSL